MTKEDQEKLVRNLNEIKYAVGFTQTQREVRDIADACIELINKNVEWKPIEECPHDTSVLLLYHKHNAGRRSRARGLGRGTFITEGTLTYSDDGIFMMFEDYTGRQLWNEDSNSKNKVLGWTELPNTETN